MRRPRRTYLACAVLAIAGALAGTARAGPGMLVGAADDSLKWASAAQAHTTIGYARDLGVRAIRITVPWKPGETSLSLTDRRPIDRAVLATWSARLRIVLAVYGRPDDAPRDDASRQAYCTYAASLLHRYPGVNDVVIWNEPNVSRFWRPQFAPDGTSLAPAAYEALLARCWDTLHAVRPGVNVIAASAPRGNDRPAAASNVSHAPVTFYRELGKAYRASGRRLPIFDTVGHNPYPDSNAERPWARHPKLGNVGEGDYDKLMGALEEAFGGTGQPVPGRDGVTVWYMEQGFQTTIDPAKRVPYTGVENDPGPLPPVAPRAPAGTDRPAPDQATQIGDALRLAYCQPTVGAFFTFELADEPDLAGWQSGVLWADLTPKPSYQAFKNAAADVVARRVDCNRYEQASLDAGAEIGFTATPAADGKASTTTVVAR